MPEMWKVSRATCIVLLMILPLMAEAASGSREFRYDPAVVKLSGTVVLRAYAGPPNFESIRRGDRLERCWILKLNAPIDVVADEDDDDNETQRGVSEIQIVLLGAERPSALLRAGRRVIVSGRLFSWQTAHHRTPVLIAVSGLEVNRGLK